MLHLLFRETLRTNKNLKKITYKNVSAALTRKVGFLKMLKGSQNTFGRHGPSYHEPHKPPPAKKFYEPPSSAPPPSQHDDQDLLRRTQEEERRRIIREREQKFMRDAKKRSRATERNILLKKLKEVETWTKVENLQIFLKRLIEFNDPAHTRGLPMTAHLFFMRDLFEKLRTIVQKNPEEGDYLNLDAIKKNPEITGLIFSVCLDAMENDLYSTQRIARRKGVSLIEFGEDAYMPSGVDIMNKILQGIDGWASDIKHQTTTDAHIDLPVLKKFELILLQTEQKIDGFITILQEAGTNLHLPDMLAIMHICNRTSGFFAGVRVSEERRHPNSVPVSSASQSLLLPLYSQPFLHSSCTKTTDDCDFFKERFLLGENGGVVVRVAQQQVAKMNISHFFC